MQNWIPNFNKLDITIDMGTIILGNTLSQFLHWHQMYLRFPVKASRKVIPNRYSSQVEQNGTVPVLIPAKLLK
jgi:hypothetical protein